MPPRKPIATANRPASDDVAVDHRARLIALRDRLTAELDVAGSAYVAGLSRQLQSVLAELATMRDPDAAPDLVQQLRAQRAARLEQARRDLEHQDDPATTTGSSD